MGLGQELQPLVPAAAGVLREAPVSHTLFYKPGKELLTGSCGMAPHTGRDKASSHMATAGTGSARVTQGRLIRLEGTNLTLQQKKLTTGAGIHLPNAWQLL